MTPDLQAQCYGVLKWLIPALVVAWCVGFGLVLAWFERND